MTGILSRLAAMAFVLAAGCDQAGAYTLLGNQGQTATGSASTVNDTLGKAFGWRSTVGNALLGNVSINLSRGAGTGSAGITPSLALYTVITGIPTTSPVVTFNVPDMSSLSTTGTFFTFTPQNASYTLAANTDYYLVLRNAGSTPLRWMTTSGSSALNNGATAATTAGTGGAVNLTRANTSVDYTAGALSPNLLIQVEYTPVPEPATFAMLAGSGLLGFALVRRSKAN